MEGKEHGDWVVVRDKGGGVEEGPYVEGKRHGEWMIYTEGKKERNSISTLIYENGSVAPVPLKPEMVVIPAGSIEGAVGPTVMSGRECAERYRCKR